MSFYAVINLFEDELDGNRFYKVGDLYPRAGLMPSEARIKELMGQNTFGKTFLQKYTVGTGVGGAPRPLNLETEMAIVRGASDTVEESLQKQFDKKVETDHVWTMDNMGQDVKLGMTGGSVAVVGEGSVDTINIKKEAVTFDKTDFLDYGENKANPHNYMDGHSINGVGTLSVDAGYSASDFIPAKAGITYVIYPNNTTIKRPTFYNSSKAFLENLITQTTTAPINYTPSVDGYIRLGVLTTGKMSVSVVNQAYSKGFEPFYIKGADNLRTKPLKDSVGSEELKDNVVTAKKVTFFDGGYNIFEEDAPVADSFKNLLGPTTKQTSTLYVLYDEVPITGGEKLYYQAFGTGKGLRFLLYFDSADSFISGVDFGTAGARTYELAVPVNAIRAAITVFKTNTSHVLSRHHNIVEGQSNHQIKPYHIANINPQVTPLARKRLLGFGDSIGQGGGNVVSGSGYGYVEMVAEDNQMTHRNYSVGGATIAYRDGYTNQIIDQINTAINDGEAADYILFNGLTNDASATPIGRIGEMTGGYTDTLDSDTFAGAFEHICRTLILNWLGAKIIYVRVHNMSSRGTQQVLYGELAVKICKKYSIPAVDMYSEGGLNTQMIEMTNLYTNNGDSTHPNDLGYRKFYVPRIEAKMKSV